MCIERLSEYFEEGSKQYDTILNACIEDEYAALLKELEYTIILKKLEQAGSSTNRNIP